MRAVIGFLAQQLHDGEDMDGSLTMGFAAAALGALAPTGALVFLNRVNPSAAYRWWAAAFAVGALRYSLLLATPLIGKVQADFGADAAQALGAIFLFAGTVRHVGRRVDWRLVAVGVVAVIAWAAFASYVMSGFLLRTVPLYALGGVAMIAMGWAFIAARPAYRLSGHVFVGSCSILFGLHKFDYPFLRNIEWFAPYGFTLAEALSVAMALGIIISVQRRQQVIAEELADEASARAAEVNQARESAEIANRSKTMFIANMSHELRTPLNAVIGFSEVLERQMFGPIGAPRYLDYVANIHDSARHLLDTVNDLLEYSAVESGAAKLNEQAVDLERLVTKCHNILAGAAEKAGVTLDIEAAPGLPEIRGDRGKLRQVLLNLIGNAIKFTDEGGWVVTTIRRSGKGGVEMVVADTGIGMTEDDIAVAMEPFGQVHEGLNRRYEGTGLGLPLSRRLVEIHGGEMSIDSTPGVGSRITVRLPESSIVTTEARSADGVTTAGPND